MKIFSIFLFLTIVSCGSTYIEYPTEHELDNCYIAEKIFLASVEKNILPLPFKGSISYRLYTDKPQNWDQFNGQIYIKSIKWNIDWINHLSIKLGGLTVASWKNNQWWTSSIIDIAPYFANSEERTDRLKFEVTLSGHGTRPARATIIEVRTELYFCGENSGLISEI